NRGRQLEGHRRDARPGDRIPRGLPRACGSGEDVGAGPRERDMFCPQCEGEYREGIEMCPTCEVALVADLSVLPSAAPAPRGDTMFPAAAERGELAMVDLIGFVDEADARAARATLKAADVPSELVIRDAFGPGSSKGDEYWIR